MRQNFILIFIITLFVVFTNFGKVSALINQNIYSISVVSQLNQNEGMPIHKITTYDNNNCHIMWLKEINSIAKNQNERDFQILKKLISCSILHTEMIKIIFPSQIELAEEAVSVYPNTRVYFLWLLDSIKNDSEYSRRVINQLLELDPSDALVWRRYGNLLWQEKIYDNGLQAYLKACDLDDEASNGCYYVGTSYWALGELEKAIYYFRLSYWSPSWEIADQLEAELSTQNP